MEEENISMRGRLIKNVLQHFAYKNIWSNEITNDDIKTELKNHLSFDVDVQNVNSKDKYFLSRVYFEDENKQKRSVDFTVIPKVLTRFDSILM